MSPSTRTSIEHLQEPYRTALEQALAWLPSVAEPVGIVVSGSIVRGNPGPSSDLDIVVLHDGAWRRRVQRRFNGIPAELFFNSPAWLEHSVRDEAARGRPVMAHMLATGSLVKDTGERMASAIAAARDVLARGPALDADALRRDRYAAACQVKDALDFGDADTADARQALAWAVNAVVRHAYLKANWHLPRPKERLALLAAVDPDAAGLLSAALGEAPARARDALRQAADSVLGTRGFFEWDSGPDHSTPEADR
ncbi:nucleotidyltransferase domain-containing protein [Xylophilus sp.]|uniref:nucleotidyltransferase domain-containing protein n=1 Tax=Xylophilus sp. TaxID=2653893 RepID=UPI0013BD3187|nr:nucleotidyltransferase domain-containing protein [Xylophilus sp.]KAF1046202.1 MAG: hypothetical protein GAK38_02599 [Xylophilus sp.]